MKFCFITYRFRSNNIGGGELYLEKLSAELINQGHDVYIISPDCKDISNISCFSSVSSIENLEEARNQKLHVMKFKNSPINDLMEKESRK